MLKVTMRERTALIVEMMSAGSRPKIFMMGFLLVGQPCGQQIGDLGGEQVEVDAARLQ
jgi:hypothetical protein